MESIHYSIFPVDPGAHLFEIALWIAEPDPAGQVLSLPTWIPGSYLIREFARHIDRVSAFSLPCWVPLPTQGTVLTEPIAQDVEPAESDSRSDTGSASRKNKGTSTAQHLGKDTNLLHTDADDHANVWLHTNMHTGTMPGSRTYVNIQTNTCTDRSAGHPKPADNATIVSEGPVTGERIFSNGATCHPMSEALNAVTMLASPVDIQKRNKNSWRCAPLSEAGNGLLLRYRVYAWDLSVRAAHLDESHGFFNGSSVFLCVRGQERRPCTVDIHPPAGVRYSDWHVATTLPFVEASDDAGSEDAHRSAAKGTRCARTAPVRLHDEQHQTKRRQALASSVPAHSERPVKTTGVRRSIESAAETIVQGKIRTVATQGNKIGSYQPLAPLGRFGRYRACDYDELVDHPVEMGRFQWASFEVYGCRHDIAITGRAEVDFDRLIRDLKPICQAQIELFEPRTLRAPVKRYLFMTMVVGDGYGGLEHRASTALVCSRNDLPWPGMQGTPDGYRTFLGLASHEYFHTWHVKRIKPARFDPYDLDRENYTQLLWVFEGFTSYYDDLMLVRSGVIDQSAYLKLLEQNIRRVAGNPGRFMQSVAESSHDAWIKYYRSDENTNNTVSSYYVKGALVALCLDLAIRAKTDSRHSLDDVMRLMWQRYGRDFYETQGSGRGVAEDEMPALIKEATGLNLSRQIKAWAYGTEELPLARCLKPFGLKLSVSPNTLNQASLGAKTTLRNGELTIVSAERGGPVSNAGLSSGDTLVAIDGLRATEAGLKTLLTRSRPDDVVSVVAFRRDELISTTVRLAPAPGELTLSTADERNEARSAWLSRAASHRRKARS